MAVGGIHGQQEMQTEPESEMNCWQPQKMQGCQRWMRMNFCYVCAGTELPNPNWFKVSQQQKRANAVVLVLRSQLQNTYFPLKVELQMQLEFVCIFKVALGFMTLVALQWDFHCNPAECFLLHCFHSLALDQRRHKSMSDIQKSSILLRYFYSFLV